MSALPNPHYVPLNSKPNIYNTIDYNYFNNKDNSKNAASLARQSADIFNYNQTSACLDIGPKSDNAHSPVYATVNHGGCKEFSKLLINSSTLKDQSKYIDDISIKAGSEFPTMPFINSVNNHSHSGDLSTHSHTDSGHGGSSLIYGAYSSGTAVLSSLTEPYPPTAVVDHQFVDAHCSKSDSDPNVTVRNHNVNNSSASTKTEIFTDNQICHRRVSSYNKDVDRNLSTIKCMFLGESGVGKTSLVISYTENGYPNEHKPTAFDNYSVELVVDEKPICLQIYDTGGEPEVRSLRQLSMADCQVFLLCFSVMQPLSLDRIRSIWLEEIRDAIPSARTPANQSAANQSPASTDFCSILVGCQCDLRNDVSRVLQLGALGQQPIEEAQARALAHSVGAVAYVECSALTQKHLDTLFKLTIVHGLRLCGGGGGTAAVSSSSSLAVGGCGASSSASLSHHSETGLGVRSVSGDCGPAIGGGDGPISARPQHTSPSTNHVKSTTTSWKRLFCSFGADSP